jgi:O-antigen ligase
MGAGRVAVRQGDVALVSLAPAHDRHEVRIAAVLSAALVLLIIANLGRIPVLSTGGRDIPLLVNDLLVAGVIASGALAMASHRTMRLDWTATIALLFAAVGAFSTFLAVPRFALNGLAVFVSLAYLARWLFYFAIYVVAINCLRARDVERVWTALEMAILLFAIFGIFQAAFLPGFAQMVYKDSRPYMDWDPQGHRLVSTFLDPNFAGAFIDVALVVGFARLAAGVRVAGWKMLVLATALVLTASRSSILAFLVGGASVLLIRGVSKKVLRVLVAAAVVVLLALPKLLAFARAYNKLTLADASALARLTSFLHGWTVLKDHWLIGTGFNTWGYVAERYGYLRSFTATYGLDGGLFFVLVMTGIVGLTIYVAMLGAIALQARRVWRDASLPPEVRGLAIGAAAMIPTICVHSLFTNSLLEPFLMETLWVLWALPFVARNP